MPLQATSGAASYDAFGGGVPVVPAYIEEVFSTYLYTGTGSAQTITNGIDLSTKGGLVWTKGRNYAFNHWLIDTARSKTQVIKSNTTDGNQSLGGGGGAITSFNTNGYGVNLYDENNSPDLTFVSWTFRKQPKFFDIVTYTGNGTAGRTVAHNLGSVPGFIVVKQTGGGSTGGVNNWFIYHRSLGGTKYMCLDGTFAAVTSSSPWNNTDPTSTVFTIGGTSDCNDTDGTYVAYLFAHNAGGFGLTGTDNVISCGTFEGTANTAVTLGYEPQWILVKSSSGGSNWQIIDTMRGMVVGSAGPARLNANTSGAESNNNLFSPTATGFVWTADAVGNDYIYIAIRRGPMKVPTSGTSVYNAIVRTGTGATATVTGVGFATDAVICKERDSAVIGNIIVQDRLRGAGATLYTTSSSSEGANTDGLLGFDLMNGYRVGTGGSSGQWNYSTTANNYINHFFKRAPSFFDVVCYTGTGSARTVTHNLQAVPELMIIKSRTATWNWAVYHSALGNTQWILLDSDGGPVTQSNVWNNTSPTSSVFTVGSYGGTNASAGNYVAYLFATCAGVSKVGSYTGTGTTLQIDCGFTGGARFVLIKRSQDGFSGDWYVWDSARGIVSGNDSYLLLNSTAAEVTNTDYIDTYSAGFEISSTAPAAINASGGSFIFFAVA
jgi:hypothetical protein